VDIAVGAGGGKNTELLQFLGLKESEDGAIHWGEGGTNLEIRSERRHWWNVRENICCRRRQWLSRSILKWKNEEKEKANQGSGSP